MHLAGAAVHAVKPQPRKLAPLNTDLTFLPTEGLEDDCPSLNSLEEANRIAAKKALDLDLIHSIKSGDLTLFKELSNQLEDVNCLLELDPEHKASPLLWTIKERQLPICRYLVEERGATLDSEKGLRRGDVPLIVQALNRKTFTICKYLLSKGAYLDNNFSYKDPNGQVVRGPPVTYYSNRGDTKRLQVLIESFGANIIDIKDSKDHSPLFHILQQVSIEEDPDQRARLQAAALLLVDSGADVDERDDLGNTLLMKLAEENCIEGGKC